MSTPPVLRVALIGTAFMGRAHSQAWRVAPRVFELPRRPEMTVIVGRDPERTQAAARQQGWAESATDWRAVVERPDIDLVDICTPGDSHEQIALAALAAGKHVLCEKPLATTVVGAERMAAAARAASARGVLAMCGFSYRRTPAVALMQRIVAEGRLGEIRHIRGQYLQDWLSDPESPLTWRLDREKAGSGALGDIGAHIVDASQWIAASFVTAVSAQLRTFVPTRPVLAPPSAERSSARLGGRGAAGDARGPVTVDDAAAFTATFDNGALGVFEATRMALGRRNANRIELDGSAGSVAFDFERMNELRFYDGADEPGVQGFRLIQVTEPEHPYLDAWWPAGHGLGYEHAFVHEVVDLVHGIDAGRSVHPTFDDAAQVQRVLAAVEASAADESRLTRVEDAR